MASCKINLVEMSFLSDESEELSKGRGGGGGGGGGCGGKGGGGGGRMICCYLSH